MSQITDEFRKQLHEELADATKLVWQMQNGLTESTGEACDHDVALGAAKLVHRANVIAGIVSRWMLWQIEGRQS